MSNNLNPRGQYKTFTSMLEPSHEIIRVLNQITDKMQGSVNEVSRWIIGRVLNEAKPQCVTFICWRFSRQDVATWVSSAAAAAHTRLQNLPFEVYIQSNSGIELSRLHYWMKDAKWINIGGKLIQCGAYKNLCASGTSYEIGTHGVPALEKAGRYKTSTVRPTTWRDDLFHNWNFGCRFPHVAT